MSISSQNQNTTSQQTEIQPDPHNQIDDFEEASFLDVSFSSSSSVSNKEVDTQLNWSEQTPQVLLINEIYQSIKSEKPNLPYLSKVINKFLSYQFSGIRESSIDKFKFIVKRIEKQTSFLNFLQNYSNSPEVIEFLTEGRKFLAFNHKLLKRNNLYIINTQINNSLLKKKRSPIDLQILSKIRSINEKGKSGQVNNVKVKLNVNSPLSTCESSPNHSGQESINNIFNDLSNYSTYSILKILNVGKLNSKTQSSIPSIQWNQNLDKEKIFLFTEEPCSSEVTQKEYEYIQAQLQANKANKIKNNEVE